MADIHLGPPYSNFRMVRSFPPPEDGLWSVAKFTPTTGGLVLQSGANGPLGIPEGVSTSARYERDLTPATTGMYTFRFLVNIGPISLLPRGDVFEQNQIDATIRMSLVNITGATASFSVHAGTGSGFVGRNFGTKMFSFSANLTKGVKYTLEMRQFLEFDYGPGLPNPAPYGEIIATYQETVEVTPDVVAAAQAAAPETAKTESRMQNQVVEATDEEMARVGTFELK